MIKISDLEKAVSDLPPKGLAEFRHWFTKFDAAKWDRQFEEDVRTGKLDKMALKAISDYKKGRCKDL